MSQLLSELIDKGVKPTGICSDSRKVQAGYLFLAYPGEMLDGRQYIPQAIAHGAAAVVWEQKDFVWKPEWVLPNLAVANLRQQAGYIADGFYAQPSKSLWMVGITGTNGKTTCSNWLAQAFAALERKPAVIGTLGNGFAGALTPTLNTTPDPVQLHGMLAEYLQMGAKTVVMEVSSHGLDQGRVNGVHFDVAVLTNLTRDHLDYHGDMATYAAAKRKLFDWDGLGCAVINADDPFGAELVKALTDQGKQVLTYGLSQGDVRGSSVEFDSFGISMQVATPEGKAHLRVPVVGRFNAYNLLAVLASLLASQVKLVAALGVMARLQTVPGRMQRYGGGKKPLVVVDYAHTSDALENVLKSLSAQTNGKLICVFGCGGARDKGKRPLMGEVATRLASSTIITTDNPRSENPDDIIQDIIAGATGYFSIEPDRAKAIAIAIESANAGDVVLIAGKGHEDYQEIAGVKYPFSDAQIVEQVLKGLAE
jgi:UDP-N-acetylmuramoyl-L-alanyl-D-glutamate--2,6-diaminopimelate ligase